MKSFIGFLTATFWLVLCLIVAFVLLAIAFIYNVLVLVRNTLSIGKIELPGLRIAK